MAMSSNPINGKDANSDNLRDEATLTKDLHFIWIVRTFGEHGPGVAYTTKTEALIAARPRASSPPISYAYEPAVENPYADDHLKITRTVQRNHRYESGPRDIEIWVCKIPLGERR